LNKVGIEVFVYHGYVYPYMRPLHKYLL